MNTSKQPQKRVWAGRKAQLATVIRDVRHMRVHPTPLQIRLRKRLVPAAIHAALLCYCELHYVSPRLPHAELRAAAMVVASATTALAFELPRQRVWLRAAAAAQQG
jgi:hypothetical protein